MIRKATIQDAKQLLDIYNHYILDSIFTFETEVISLEEMENRMQQILEHFPYYVFELENEIIGYAYANGWNKRSAYKFTVEGTIYLKPNLIEKGIGTKLYTKLIDELRSKKYHAIVAGISMPNIPSVALHEKLGFEKIAHFRELGYKFDKWIDVAYWQLLLK